MVGQRNRCAGRFFGRRVNCERVPLLAAWIVARMLSDPRRIPYLLVWNDEQDDAVKEAVRIARHNEMEGLGGLDWTDAVEVKRYDGTRVFLRTWLRRMPRNQGRFLLLRCPYCSALRRGLYGWEARGPYTSSARNCDWKCRSCAALRYASEGGALTFSARGSLGRMFGGCRGERPEPWLPHVFTSIDDPALDEIVRQNRSEA